MAVQNVFSIYSTLAGNTLDGHKSYIPILGKGTSFYDMPFPVLYWLSGTNIASFNSNRIQFVFFLFDNYCELPNAVAV